MELTMNTMFSMNKDLESKLRVGMGHQVMETGVMTMVLRISPDAR